VDVNSPWQIYATSTDSWLDQRTVAAIRAELPALADEVVRAIQREVPAYSRPLSGEFGRGIRLGTEIALRRFIGDDPEGSLAVYRTLGYGEHRAGRSLDALQSAYRVGARVAWRRMSHAAAELGASAETQRNLAEAMFAYIDQLAGESIEGYAERQLAQAGDVERRRASLIALLLDGAPPETAALNSAAEAARWKPPRTAACLALGGQLASTGARRLSGDVLAREQGGITCVLVPHPTQLEREARDLASRLHLRVALGPTVALADARSSLRWARLALDLIEGDEGVIVAEQCLAQVALRSSADLVAALRERALRPLAGETERSRERLETTLLAWLRRRGSQRAVAADLTVHPQTVRYRVRRLRGLFGAALEDPERRFELEIALRAWTPVG
jgi:hypothetical protein